VEVKDKCIRSDRGAQLGQKDERRSRTPARTQPIVPTSIWTYISRWEISTVRTNSISEIECLGPKSSASYQTVTKCKQNTYRRRPLYTEKYFGDKKIMNGMSSPLVGNYMPAMRQCRSKQSIAHGFVPLPHALCTKQGHPVSRLLQSFLSKSGDA